MGPYRWSRLRPDAPEPRRRPVWGRWLVAGALTCLALGAVAFVNMMAAVYGGLGADAWDTGAMVFDVIAVFVLAMRGSFWLFDTADQGWWHE